jgi:hypothetical protein
MKQVEEIEMETKKTGAVRNQRKAQETKMWSNDIRQVVGIFQERFHADEVIMDAAKYVARYQSELKAAGPELAFLQLASPDEKSPFGWKPTARLMELIAARTKSKKFKKLKRLYEADIWYQLLNDYVFGYESDRGEGSVFTYELLVAIGLMHEEAGSAGWVTEPLHILFDNGYYAKRQRDGLAILPELSPGPYQVVMRPGS